MKKLALVCMLIVLASSCFAIGIMPPSLFINFEPGKNFTFNFLVLDVKYDKVKIENYVRESTLSQYVNLGPLEKVGNDKATFNVTLSLPNKIDTPGVHRILVGVRELPLEEKQGIGAFAAVQAIIDVLVPWSGEYLKVDLIPQNLAVNSTGTFKIKLSNWGTVNTTTSLKLLIMDLNKAILSTISVADNVFIESFETKEFSVDVNSTGYAEGAYLAVAIAKTKLKEYSSEEKKFMIGSLKLKILDFTKTVIQDKINPFKIKIKSYWNDIISDVYAEVQISKDGIVIDSFKSASCDIKPWSEADIVAYWDTSGIEAGAYLANITVFYQNKEEHASGYVIVRAKKEVPVALIVGGFILLVVIVNIIIWIMLVRKQRREEKSTKRKTKRK